MDYKEHGHGHDDHHHGHEHHGHHEHNTDCGCYSEKSIEISVDGECFTVGAHKLTPNEVLKVAGLDPADNYLVKIYHGRPGDSFEDTGDTPIDFKDCDKFIAVSKGPTPVS